MAYDDQLLREKVFRDPVHNYVYIQHQLILDLIGTREFQRLRRIKQLGTTSLTFPGAEHSRFTHSLGVYEITRRICDNFQRNFPTQTPGDGLWDDSERLVALCAALLHDIGHGPYSHTFEHIFHTNHEAITVAILTSPETEINQVLSQVSPDFPAKVASVIQKTYENPQVVQMISSQLDADRMDYLLRDAYFTGTKYGTFDLDRVLRIMRPYAGGITFEINGMHTVEDYIMSRFQMYQQIYFHPTSRSMEVILSHLLERSAEVYTDLSPDEPFTPDLLMPFFRNEFNLQDYLNLDDGVLNTYFSHWRQSDDPILADLSRRFLDRKPLKNIIFEDETAPLLDHMRELIAKVGFDTKYYTDINDSFDLPYDDSITNQLKKPNAQVELMNHDGSLIELSTVSPLVNAISGKFTGDQRFFFPAEMIEAKQNVDLFDATFKEFNAAIENNHLINPEAK